MDEAEELDTEAVLGPAHGPATESPEDRFFRSVLHGDLDRALKALLLAFREAVFLADLEGLSYTEAAQVRGCPIGTVMSRLAPGRSRLRKTLGGFGREHGYVQETDSE